MQPVDHQQLLLLSHLHLLAGLLERSVEPPLEVLHAGEDRRQQEVQQRPELRQVVLPRRTVPTVRQPQWRSSRQAAAVGNSIHLQRRAGQKQPVVGLVVAPERHALKKAPQPQQVGQEADTR